MEPQPKSIWRHYKGGYYRVICVANIEGSRVEVVVYQALQDCFYIWARPLHEWEETVFLSGDDPGRPRFKEMQYALLPE